ncbi:tRNA pseudouridine(38-40) synthase TruA [Nitrincola alkalilacustris]|uniref:tRNA pseudouridine(38-40) synthase TruA n=1 Tax=Nitrincola alkalilacustris TaxID=1571224 RepID=UPI00124E1037|nr:tRNA pseudouridine(38-40) synthase TruA [Nitrincola alkalilacustris]
MSETENQGAISIAPYRYALAVEYNGSAYRGWQKQSDDDVPSLQSEVERALSRVANHPVQVVCAGRTDAGVHATWQIIHFDSCVERDLRAWVLGTNTYLPDDISIQWARSVTHEFHARFSARARRYRYLIYSSPVKPALLSRGVTWTHKSFDLESMQRAAESLVGEHDFTSYRAVGCQAKSPVRTIQSLEVTQRGRLIMIDVRANAFLHHMVRNIAGVLMKIGSGEASIGWAREVLEARDRRMGGVTAPPFGLYFVDVDYPDLFDLPVSPLGPYFLSGAD